MTIPSERTRALLQVGELLRELSTGELTLDQVRRHANVALHHYSDPAAIALGTARSCVAIVR